MHLHIYTVCFSFDVNRGIQVTCFVAIVYGSWTQKNLGAQDCSLNVDRVYGDMVGVQWCMVGVHVFKGS